MRCAWLILPVLSAWTMTLTGAEFQPPDSEARRAAIGDVTDLPPVEQRAFTDWAGFAPIPVPGPHDWLAIHAESGQTWRQWLAARPNLPDQRRRTIYLQPLGDFAGTQGDLPEELRRFTAIYFGLETRLLPAQALADLDATRRANPHTGREQFLAPDLLTALQARLPKDAYCLLGITLADLYPDPAWNFVFGMASLRDRVGIFSLARYDDRFLDPEAPATVPADHFRRCCKVLAHETGHMFGIAHETFFHCLMNGSNHLAETDASPLHLGPLSLRKLQRATGFDVRDRYRRLGEFYRERGLIAEADWVAARLARLE